MDYVWKAGMLCTVAGYLLGSILFAPFFVQLFRNLDLEASSKDGNPGTANAFIKGGFWCGSLALLGDMGKGILPVAFFYILFSLMRIQPHSRRTVAAFLAASAGVFIWVKKWKIALSVWSISALVIHKHAVSERKKETVLEKERNGV